MTPRLQFWPAPLQALDIVSGPKLELHNMGDIKGNVFDAKLGEFMVIMKCHALETFQPFLSFLNGFHKKKGHNMLALMFNPRFKNM